MAQIYGAGRVWGLSYSCRLDGGLHYSASNLHALTAREGPAALLEPGIVLLLARRWWRPGSWAQARATHAQAETWNRRAQPTRVVTPAEQSPISSCKGGRGIPFLRSANRGTELSDLPRRSGPQPQGWLTAELAIEPKPRKPTQPRRCQNTRPSAHRLCPRVPEAGLLVIAQKRRSQ